MKLRKLLFSIIAILSFCSCENIRHQTITCSEETEIRSYENIEGDVLTLKNINIKDGYYTKQVVICIENYASKYIKVEAPKEVFNYFNITSNNNRINILGNKLVNLESAKFIIYISGYRFRELDLDCVDCYIDSDCLKDDFRIKESGISVIALGGSKQFKNVELEISEYSIFEADQFIVNNLTCDVSSSSTIRSDALYLNRGIINLYNSSKAELGGACKYLDLNVKKASNASISDLEAYLIVADVSNNSSATLKVLYTLEVNLSKASSITYYGDPVVVKDKIPSDCSLNRG